MDLHEVMLRAFEEEICDIDKDKTKVTILGIVFDREYNQWNNSGTIRTIYPCRKSSGQGITVHPGNGN